MEGLGKCQLCLNGPVELRNSHFFPAAAYKIMREHTIRVGRFRNPNPLQLTDISALQTSKQYTARLLCHRCEQRFHANGENWVLRHCWRGSTFLLSSLVAGATAELISPEASAYHAALIPGIEVRALTYFAVSMFWRAAVHNWSGRSIEPAIDLGPYREQLRAYLNGEAEFPRGCILCVQLPTRNTEFVTMMVHPYPTRTRGIHVYTLLFLGIGFALFVGRQIPQAWREVDFVRGTGNPIFVMPGFEGLFQRDLSLLFGGRGCALSMLDKIQP
jgi:hypothetical protein